MRDFGQRCTRCLKGEVGQPMLLLPIMECMVLLCHECTKEYLMMGVIAKSSKAAVVKIKPKGGDS